MLMQGRLGRFDNVSIGGTAVFGALSVLLTGLSQALGLNFPLIPYLQFDFGEVAILLAFFIFGPVPAIVSSVIEFLTLMAIGQNAPVGPLLKIIAILSSLIGVWLGAALTSRLTRPTLGRVFGVGTLLGLVFRAVIMTIANYYLIVYLFTLSGIVGFLAVPFKLIGVTLTGSNGLSLVLGITAVFNCLQLLLALLITYALLRLPQIQNTRAAGRSPWVTALIRMVQLGRTAG